MEGDQYDQPYPQAVVLSQTRWEYRTLLSQESASDKLQHSLNNKSDEARKSIVTAPPPPPPPSPPPPPPPASELCPKQAKTKVSGERGPRCSGTTSLETLRRAGTGKTNTGVGSWDIFALVLQASGLQRTTSKRGSEIDIGTLLIADQSLSFFRLTLWGRAARAGGRLVRAGDLIRVNGVGAGSFRGTVQACSTRSTSFRVVWRDDAFTTPQDAPSTTMLSQRWPSTRGRCQLQPGHNLSQDDDLEVSREAACALAAWAKTEFPSVTSSESYAQNQQNRREAVLSGEARGGAGSAGIARTGSLGSVRKGVETTVRACVLEVSEVERLWLWESTGGKRRKDLVSRATALLTDGLTEMTLQLWGDMASDETINLLREGSIAAANGLAAGTIVEEGVDQPAVFEFTRLQPSFSFSCEALVLNGKSGAATRMEDDSAEAVSVSKAVLASAAAAAAAAATAAAAGESTAYEENQRAPVSVETAEGLCAESPSVVAAGEGAPASARRFESVAALMSADGFSGAAYLPNVVVRKVYAPSLTSPRLCPTPDIHGPDADLPPASRWGGIAPPVIIYLGDPEESGAAAGGVRAAGVEAVLGATADGGALRDLLGCVPVELPGVGRDSHGGGDHVADLGGMVARSLLDGLEVGGKQGERVDAALSCSASVDENGRVMPGGSSYRLVSLHPKYISDG